MTLQEAQDLAIKTWGKDAIAEEQSDGICFVSRTKYGLATPYGHGKTFEAAFYVSQFGYTNCALHEASESHPQFHCHFGGSVENIAGWPEDWNPQAVSA